MTDDPLSSGASMSLIEHLRELRTRLLRAVAAVLVVTLGLTPFANRIYAFASAPLQALLPPGSSMIATEVTSPFFAPFKLTVVAGVFLAIPVILHQAWAFIAPGLYGHERRLALPILFSSTLLFYLGVAFAYFVVLPLVFAFFTSVGPSGVQVMTDINAYLDFILKLFFAFGLAFEIPIATLVLIRGRIVSADALAAKRPYVIIACFVAGMLLTPPDIISQTLLALPMWLLFEAGILLGRWTTRARPGTP